MGQPALVARLFWDGTRAGRRGRHPKVAAGWKVAVRSDRSPEGAHEHVVGDALFAARGEQLQHLQMLDRRARRWMARSRPSASAAARLGFDSKARDEGLEYRSCWEVRRSSVCIIVAAWAGEVVPLIDLETRCFDGPAQSIGCGQGDEFGPVAQGTGKRVHRPRGDNVSYSQPAPSARTGGASRYSRALSATFICTRWLNISVKVASWNGRS